MLFLFFVPSRNCINLSFFISYTFSSNVDFFSSKMNFYRIISRAKLTATIFIYIGLRDDIRVKSTVKGRVDSRN